MGRARKAPASAPDQRALGWAALFAAPLAVRGLVFWELRDLPFFRSLFVDARTYHEMAVRLSSGTSLGDAPFWQPPLFPYALSWLYRLLGPDPDMARLGGLILGSVSCVLLFVLADRVSGRPAAWIAWAGMTLYGPFVFFDLQLLNVTLGTFLLLAFLLSMTTVLERMSSGTQDAGGAHRGRAPLGRALTAGAWAGLGAVNIGNMLILAPVAALWVLLWFRSRSAILVGLVLILGSSLPIAIVTARNLAVSGEPVLVSYNGGVNFWIGNNPDYESTIALRPGRAWTQLTAEPREAGFAGYEEQSRYFYAKAWDWMKSAPANAVSLLARKARSFLRADEVLRNQQIYPFRSDSRVLGVLLWIHGIGFPFGLLLPLAGLGAIGALASRTSVGDPRDWARAPRPGARELATRHRGPIAFLLVVALAYSASVIAYFVTARYRLPVVPILLIFAAGGLCELKRVLGIPREKPLRLAATALVLAAGGVVANVGLPPMPSAFNSDAHSDLALTHHVEGDRISARREYERAIELDPGNLEARNNLAGLLDEDGAFAGAVLQLRVILEAYPEDRRALANLGRAYLALGRPYDAGKCYHTLLRLDSGDPGAARGVQSASEMADRVEADELAADAARFLESMQAAVAADPENRFLSERLRLLAR